MSSFVQIAPNAFAPVTAPDYRFVGAAGPTREPIYEKHQVPTDDPRYPGYSATMSDGRFATDYRMHCSANIPSGSQRSTRAWMQNNAEKIISVSRSRMAERLAFSEIVPTVPEQSVVTCQPYGCEVRTVNEAGIGQGRPNGVPELFGTFIPELTMQQKLIHKNIAVTRVYEGGVNTPSRFRFDAKLIA